jgi:spore maturation protein CgeB
MGGYLLQAAQSLSLTARLHNWSAALRSRALIVRTNPQSQDPSLLEASAKELSLAAQEFDATFILNLAQAPIDAQGLALIRKEVKGALLAFWFVEDIKRFTYVHQIAPAYDLFFHIQEGLMTEPTRRWGLKGYYLPAAADDSVFFPGPAPKSYAAILSFAGAGYPNRRAILADLSENYWAKSDRPFLGFKIFGSGWQGCPETLQRRLFEEGRRIRTQECALVYRGAQVSLNIHSGDGPGFDQPSAFVNPRTFELALSGSPQIIDRRSLLPGLFQADELEIVDEPRQLPEAIEKLLQNPTEASNMALKARLRVLNEHLYTHRLKYILKKSQL